MGHGAWLPAAPRHGWMPRLYKQERGLPRRGPVPVSFWTASPRLSPGQAPMALPYNRRACPVSAAGPVPAVIQQSRAGPPGQPTCAPLADTWVMRRARRGEDRLEIGTRRLRRHASGVLAVLRAKGQPAYWVDTRQAPPRTALAIIIPLREGEDE
jgi:hypothetical protein